MMRGSEPEWHEQQDIGENWTRPRAAPAAVGVVVLIAVLVTLAHIGRELTIPAGTWREDEFYILYGLIPAYVGDNPLALLTHLFVHGSWLHLMMNVAIYVMLGLVLAQRAGRGVLSGVRLFAVTVLSGLGGGLAVVGLAPGSEAATVGFSGAVCGVAAAFLLSQRGDWRQSLQDRRVLQSIAWFLALNVGLAWGVSASGLIGISWEGHLGGFIGGALGWIALAPQRGSA
jgi:membrane associated rhomboid family serine protease